MARHVLCVWLYCLQIQMKVCHTWYNQESHAKIRQLLALHVRYRICSMNVLYVNWEVTTYCIYQVPLKQLITSIELISVWGNSPNWSIIHPIDIDDITEYYISLTTEFTTICRHLIAFEFSAVCSVLRLVSPVSAYLLMIDIESPTP